jgi:hypothetical protein
MFRDIVQDSRVVKLWWVQMLVHPMCRLRHWCGRCRVLGLYSVRVARLQGIDFNVFFAVELSIKYSSKELLLGYLLRSSPEHTS